MSLVGSDVRIFMWHLSFLDAQRPDQGRGAWGRLSVPFMYLDPWGSRLLRRLKRAPIACPLAADGV